MDLSLALTLGSRMRTGVRTAPYADDPTAAYAVAGLKPNLVADAINDFFYADGAEKTFAEMFTFARASTATYVDSTGTLQTAASGVARRANHVYEGGQWVNKGLLIESQARTNLLLNSATLSTQSVTVTAAAHTLSFTGTGTVTLSGASTAGPLVGTGTGENNRVNLTFTPTAGSLTLTVTGTVTNAQLEVGPTPSSYIPTTGATATRAAETLTIPAALLPYSATAMSIAMEGTVTYADTGSGTAAFPYTWSASAANEIYFLLNDASSRTGEPTLWHEVGGVPVAVRGSTTYYSPGINVPLVMAARHTASEINLALDGTALIAAAVSGMPDLSATNLVLAPTFMGHISQFRMWSADLGDAGIEEATA